jgi:hypothetical protein
LISFAAVRPRFPSRALAQIEEVTSQKGRREIKHGSAKQRANGCRGYKCETDNRENTFRVNDLRHNLLGRLPGTFGAMKMGKVQFD